MVKKCNVNTSVEFDSHTHTQTMFSLPLDVSRLPDRLAVSEEVKGAWNIEQQLYACTYDRTIELGFQDIPIGRPRQQS